MAGSASASARWAWRFAVAGAIAFVLGPGSAHFGVVQPLTGFYLFLLGALLGLLALVTGIVAVAVGSDRAAGTRGLALGAVLFALLLLIALPGRNFPRINDITTDWENPPRLVAALDIPANAGRDMTYPGADFAAQQRAGYPDLGPLRLPAPPDDVFKLVQMQAHAVPGWTITREDPAERAIEGTETSRLFRFADDFVIEVRPAEGGSVVQMRSKSRDGRGDIGANAARIRRFFERLD